MWVVSMKRVFAAILKTIAVAVLLVGVCLYVLVNHSTLTQELTCKGYWKELGQDKEVAEVAHVQLTEYRWWLRLLGSKSDDYGFVKAQTEKYALAFYIPFVSKIGEGSLALYEFRESNPGDFRGGYRVEMGKSHSNSRITWFSSAHRAGRAINDAIVRRNARRSHVFSPTHTC